LKLDDLLGLLFVLFFIVGPVLKGLFQKERVPEILEEAFPEPPEEEVPPREKRKPEPVPVRPVAVAPAPSEPAPPAAEEPPPARRPKKLGLRLTRNAIVKGIVWHEILSEPRAKRRWPPKR